MKEKLHKLYEDCVRGIVIFRLGFGRLCRIIRELFALLFLFRIPSLCFSSLVSLSVFAVLLGRHSLCPKLNLLSLSRGAVSLRDVLNAGSDMTSCLSLRDFCICFVGHLNLVGRMLNGHEIPAPWQQWLVVVFIICAWVYRTRQHLSSHGNDLQVDWVMQVSCQDWIDNDNLPKIRVQYIANEAGVWELAILARLLWGLFFFPLQSLLQYKLNRWTDPFVPDMVPIFSLLNLIITVELFHKRWIPSRSLQERQSPKNCQCYF